MDDEIIHSWCFYDVECFDSTPSAAIIILDKDLESFSSLRSQHKWHVHTPRGACICACMCAFVHVCACVRLCARLCTCACVYAHV